MSYSRFKIKLDLFLLPSTKAFSGFLFVLVLLSFLAATRTQAFCDMRWPADPTTSCGISTQVPSQGATGVSLSPNFHWGMGGYRPADNNQCVDSSGCNTYAATVYLYLGSASNQPFARCDISDQSTVPHDAGFSCFKQCDYGNIFPQDPNTCHTDGMPNISPLQILTTYWWRVCPWGNDVVHCEQTYNYYFATGNGACTPTSTSVSMAASSCGSGNPFQNPLTVDGNTNAACIKPVNSAGQPMKLSVDGTVINWSAASGSLNNYSPVSFGTHTVTATLPGDNSWCASTGTGTITKTCSATSTTVSMASGACGSGNPFQNPLTVDSSVSTICIRAVNSGNQDMKIYFDGVLIENDLKSGSQMNYYGLTAGTHTVTASWTGNQQYCASSDTGTVTQQACIPNTLTTYFSPDNGISSYTNNKNNPYNIVLGQTTIYASAHSTSGSISRLSLNTPWWNNYLNWLNPPNDTWYPVTGNTLSLIGTYSISAYSDAANGYCAAYSDPNLTTAYFDCHGIPPTITALAPGPNPPNPVLTTPPSSFTWSVTNFGQDGCGKDYRTGDDSLTVTLYDGPNGTGTAYPQCTLSGLNASTVTSCTASGYTWPTTGGARDYSWKIFANNGAVESGSNTGAATVITNFTYNPSPPTPAWFQTDSGYVYAAGNVSSRIPFTPPCSGTNCFNSAISAGSAAVVSHGSGTPNFNGNGNVSVPQWLAEASSSSNQPSYNTFFRQIPAGATFAKVGGTINNGTINSNCNSGTECYLQYTDPPANFRNSSGTFNVQDKKIVLFIDNGATPIQFNLQPTITLGQGFFGLITSGPIQIADGTDSLSGLYYTDSTFSTCTEPVGTPCNPEKQLAVTGAIFAKGGVVLQRDLGSSLNKTTPAEVFNYDQTIPFTMPRALRRLQFQVNEVPPTQ